MANEILLKPELEKLARTDPRKIIESMFCIVDKSGQKKPFIFNPIQDLFYNARTARDDVLKARKHGISSEVLAMFTTSFLFVPNTFHVCVSHTEKDTKILLDKVYYYINNLPFKVTLAKSSAGWLRIEELNTDFIIGTAGAKSFGRGSTIHKLHLSEFAFYDNPGLMTGLMNAVPDDLENTWIVKETTANGYGNMHYNEWMEEQNGRSVFKPHFYSWFDNPEYQMKLAGNDTFSDDERKIQITFSLTDEQMKWRQWKISSMTPPAGFTKDQAFKQEFPATAEEAFISTGRPVFRPDDLEWYEKFSCMETIDKGELVGWNPPIFERREDGELKIFDRPQGTHQYVIGADVAESGDYSSAHVIDRTTAAEVANWHGHLEEYAFAQVLYRLGKYYNDALMGPEKNNQGIAVVKHLDELGYTNMYRTQKLDKMGSPIVDELGWSTNGVTRNLMITDLIQVVSEHSLVLRDKETVAEMRSFVKDEKGRPAAQQGCHDDRVISLAIAYQMYKTLPSTEEISDVVIRRYRPNTTLYKFSSKQNG